jgi:hypothetical protein
LGNDKVQRSEAVTERIKHIWNFIQDKQLSEKQIQKIRGFFNYYLCFFGNFHSFISRLLFHPFKYKFKDCVAFLIQKDYIFFNTHSYKEQISMFSDATMIGVGFCSRYFYDFQRRTPFTPILVNELNAAMLAIERFTSSKLVNTRRLLLRVDNKAVVSLINRGRCKWNVSLRFLFFALKSIAEAKSRARIVCAYIPSAENPSDVLSRVF